MNDRIQILEQRIESLEAKINVQQWLSPEKAAVFIGCKKDKIISEINRAERARNNQESPDLKLGIHYYDMATPNSTKSRWKVDPYKFLAVLQTPRENRPIYSWERK